MKKHEFISILIIALQVVSAYIFIFVMPDDKSDYISSLFLGFMFLLALAFRLHIEYKDDKEENITQKNATEQ